MFDQPSEVVFRLPKWIEAFSQQYDATTNINERMKFVISAARRNVEEATGGPFAAAVFELGSGDLVSLGVNLVTTQGLSLLHAEMVALSLAQRKLNTYDLGSDSLPRHELVASTEPCAMCIGAIPWSGIHQLVTAARDEDARAIGFDEGVKPGNWIEALDSRGINVITDIERESACSVLRYYVDNNGVIYNKSAS